jgi:ABC-2 type transport system ATP-binding protein
MHKGRMILEKDLDDLKTDTHKIQVAFKGSVPAIFDPLKILHKEKRGSIMICIVKGDAKEISSYVEQFKPVIFDMLPLTLEEIFIYEMGDIGYAVQNILG